MIQLIDVRDELSLAAYSGHFHLSQAVARLEEDVRPDVRRLRHRKVWMVNSTAQGGGVAEMLPKLVTLLRDLGVDTEWAVVGGEDEHFFEVTKRVHNKLHGEPREALGAEDREVYAAASREAADALAALVAPEDLVVVHDPQPLGAGSLLTQKLGVQSIWRCHIGLDTENASTRAAWDFLRPWLRGYQRTVFSFPEYVPPFLSDRAAIISPAIDPLSDKNRSLSPLNLAGVLSNARMDGVFDPVLTPAYDEPALRLQADGSFTSADLPTSIGLMNRPIIAQISRWDRLKGWAPLLKGFARMKREASSRSDLADTHVRRLEHCRLVLAGPDPTAIQDDPEGLAVFDELCSLWQALPTDRKQDVVLLMLPMTSRVTNALMVNALQRCSSIVAQNSLKEGFGLTVTEGMWKRCAVMGTHAVGIRNQVRDGLDGRLVDDPESEEEIAETLTAMLAHPEQLDEWGRSGQHRVAERFLIFTQVRRWLSVLSEAAQPAKA